MFDKIQTVAPGAIVENKRLGEALAFARELQASYPPNRRRGDPRRQRPPNNLEALGMPTKGRPSRKVLAAAAAERTTPAPGCHFNFAPVMTRPGASASGSATNTRPAGRSYGG